MNFISEPRGFRNNNPGNLRQTRIEWKGEEGDEAVDDDPAFEEFESVEFGIRAIGKLLDTYYHRYELKTVDDIIQRYAPGHENDTAAYVAAVARSFSDFGYGPHTILDWSSSDVRCTLVCAIIRHENGVQPFAEWFIAKCMEID